MEGLQCLTSYISASMPFRLASRFLYTVVANIFVALLSFGLRIWLDGFSHRDPANDGRTRAFPQDGRSSPRLPSVEDAQCHICLDNFTTSTLLYISTCRHTFCRDCLTKYFLGRLEQRSYPVPCPSCLTLDQGTRINYN